MWWGIRFLPWLALQVLDWDLQRGKEAVLLIVSEEVAGSIST